MKLSPCCFSDHDYVTLCLEFDQAQVRGPGLWKFNAFLLQGNEFCAIIEDGISNISAVLITCLRSSLGVTFSKLLLSQKLFSFLGLDADAYHASAFSLLTVLFLLSVASLRVIVLLPLKFLAWNLG